MPFCTQCAHAIPDGSRFCPACGAPVGSPSPVQTAPSSAPPEHLRASQTPTEAAPPSSVPPSSSVHGRFVPGTRLGTRYRIVALLGRGGMGEVYRADDLELGQSVALKFVPTSVSANEAELTRFRSEVRLARQIAHPNVCRVYDIGEADGHVFLSMEYIDGEDLASVLRRMGRPTSDKALEIARQICLGLAAAHEAGMLHRDLKPANIMVDGRGRARITDFGLAGLAAELTQGGEFAGTPAYMAPEQLDGGRVSARSDVYALGLLLYELFTGKRAFDAKSVGELKRMQESGTVTSPSDITRDIDPAVERLILHCLERNPDARPASAYAVLGALPGADPLAAALAAGETPSPELVANAGERGSLSLAAAAAWIVVGFIALVYAAGTLGHEFRSLTQPSSVLSVRAEDMIGRTGVFGALPKYTEEGFDQNQAEIKFLRLAPRTRAAEPAFDFFWRRWSPRLIESRDIHFEGTLVNDPPLLAAGEAVVLLDPAGRLIGLRAIPPDSVPPASGGMPAWSELWTASGLDPSTFAPTPLARPVPAMCDSAAAWSGPVPWNAGERVTVQMGASRGRLSHFTIVHGWGATTAPVDSLPADPVTSGGWGLFIFNLLPLVGSVLFGVRNLHAGRGDWRGATRIALFVFAMNMLSGLFNTNLSEVGLVGAGTDLVNGRALGHSLMHAVLMWFAYIALEPYVRRLWPRLLVGWTRLISGRFRDPLVGRDLLIGGAMGVVLIALGTAIIAVGDRLGLTRQPTFISTFMLTAATSLPATAYAVTFSGAVCILTALQTLVMLVIIRLVSRRTWFAIVLGMLSVSSAIAAQIAPDTGWGLAILVGIIQASAILVIMRFGVLAGAVTIFVCVLITSAVASLDLSAWYGDRALVPLLIVIAILFYGAATALAGKSIWGDPLKEPSGRP